jgi:hypothetical protein
VQRQVKSIRKIIGKAFCDCFGIAVCTARTNFVTASCRVPGSVCPLYTSMSASHVFTVSLKQQIFS